MPHGVEAMVQLPPGIAYLLNQLRELLFSFGSSFSLTSLLCAFAIAIGALAWRRYRRQRPIRLRSIMRALFPRRIMTAPSTFVDLGYLFFYVFVNGLIFGWAALSFQVVTNATISLLVSLFGTVTPAAVPGFAARATVTFALFLAYEFGYWLNHYLSHRVPVLWEFHKVHHTAEVLTPLTTFRVHPIYSWVFGTIVAFTTALTNGVVHYAFGDTTHQYVLSDTNIILVVFIHVYVHLQHSELWLPLSGWLGNLFVSPAHHQVHHSRNPAHFNKNFGSCLAVWDWLFGTLHRPSRAPEVLQFGIAPEGYDPHTITGAMLVPFARAWSCVVSPWRGRLAEPDAAATLVPASWPGEWRDDAAPRPNSRPSIGGPMPAADNVVA